MRAHEFAEFDVQLAKILFVDLRRPPAKQLKSVTFFIHSFTRLVYGDTWAGKANGVINLAAESKMRELSSTRKGSPNILAISTAIPYTSEAHICLGRPRRSGADRFCKIKSNQIKPACPWAAHLGAGDRRKPTSYVQHCTNIKSHLRFTI